MSKDAENLIWIDLEMTGLNPEIEVIIEIATIVTDKNLNILAQGPVFAIHQPTEILDTMDDWNQEHHGKSGLIERVKASTITTLQAEKATLDFLNQWLDAGQSPICGNSVWQDRRFLTKYMPTLEAFFHYRCIDVSTFKELAARWCPDVKEGFSKESTHQALDDIIESIEELRYYREHFIRPF